MRALLDKMDEQLFAQKQGKDGPAAPLQLQEAVSQITSIATRLKLAEERYSNLQKRNQITESALLDFEKETRTELRVFTQQLVELRRQLVEINSKVDVMLGELTNVVQKHEFAVVEKYLDLWQPARFVTRKEAERLIDDLRYDLKRRKRSA